GGEEVALVSSAAAPHRTNGVDHVPCLKPIATRDLGRARLATAERPAFGEQFRSSRPMDCTIDAAAAEQRTVGGVHDGIDIERGDIGHENFEPGRAHFGGQERLCGHRRINAYCVKSCGDVNPTLPPPVRRSSAASPTAPPPPEHCLLPSKRSRTAG